MSKFHQNLTSGVRGEVKYINCLRTTHNDGQKYIAIGHLKFSGDIKMATIMSCLNQELSKNANFVKNVPILKKLNILVNIDVLSDLMLKFGTHGPVGEQKCFTSFSFSSIIQDCHHGRHFEIASRTTPPEM